jgi:hypothetical protein
MKTSEENPEAADFPFDCERWCIRQDMNMQQNTGGYDKLREAVVNISVILDGFARPASSSMLRVSPNAMKTMRLSVVRTIVHHTATDTGAPPGSSSSRLADETGSMRVIET